MKRVLNVVYVLIMALAFITPSKGFSLTTYFGEDLGLGETTPLSSWPNASLAETQFLSNLTGVGTENFESYADNTSSPLAITFPGAGTATLQGSGEVNEVTPGTTNGYGRYAISGSKYWETSSALFSIEFSDPIAAFGFYGIDAGDFNGQLQLIATNGHTETLTIPHTVGAPGGTVIYFGFIDTEHTYTSIQFSNTGSSEDWFGFDDFTIGSPQQVIPPNPVPEPASMLLLSSGLLMAGAAIRRKKK